MKLIKVKRITLLFFIFSEVIFFTFFITLKRFDLFLYVFKCFQTNKKMFILLYFKSKVKLNKVKFNSPSPKSLLMGVHSEMRQT